MANFPPRAGSGNQPSSQGGGQPGGQLGSQSGSQISRPPGSGAAPPAGAVTGMRTAGVRPCPSCSTLVNVHATVCPNCGEQIAAKEKMIRCRRCRHRASSNLVVCPHCGRELQPAASRWLTWGLPLLAVLLLSGVLVVRAGRGDPSTWAQAQVDRVVRLVQSLGSRLQPDVTISMIPAGQDPNDPLVSQAAQAGAVLSAAPPAAAGVTDVTAAGGGGAAPAALESPTPVPTETAAPPVDSAAAAPDQPTETAAAVEPAPTSEPPTATPTQEPTPAPTNTPVPTATATAAATDTPTTAATSAATSAAALAAAGTLTRTAGANAKTAVTTTLASTTSASAEVTSTITLTRATAALSTQVTTQTAALLGLPTPTPVPAVPVAAPTPAATATPTPLAVYEVRRGDTLFDIATKYDVSVEDVLAANDLTEDDVYTIQPGDELKIPAPTPEGGPTPAGPEAEAATATPAPATYTVRAGDTILAIALRNDVSVEDMLAANGMTINDARTLQPGDELIIPGPEGVPTATPTATSVAASTATSTPTAAATTAPPAPTATPASVVRVDAPRLRSPENGTAVSCSGQGSLTWLQVPGVRPTDLYLVHLGYVNSVAGDGTEEVVWVISQQRPVSATSWQLDNNLCGLAPNTAGKQWRWYVEVAEQAADGLQPVSPASPVWGFAWQ